MLNKEVQSSYSIITQKGNRKFTGSPVASVGIHSHQRLQLPEKEAADLPSIIRDNGVCLPRCPTLLVKLPTRKRVSRLSHPTRTFLWQTDAQSELRNQSIQALKLIKMAPTPLYSWFCLVKNQFSVVFPNSLSKQIRFIFSPAPERQRRTIMFWPISVCTRICNPNIS